MVQPDLSWAIVVLIFLDRLSSAAMFGGLDPRTGSRLYGKVGMELGRPRRTVWRVACSAPLGVGLVFPG